MKSKIVLLLVIALALFSACTPAEESDSEQSTSTTSEADTSNAPTLKLEDFKVNADNSLDIAIPKDYWVDATIIDDFFTIRKKDNDAESNLMDVNGKLLTEDFYFNVSSFSEGFTVVQKIEANQPRTYILNKKGEVVIDQVNGQPIVSAIKFYKGMLTVMMDEEYSPETMLCIDKDGKVVQNPPVTHTYDNYYGDNGFVLDINHPRYTFYEENNAESGEEDPDYNPLQASKFGIYDLESNQKVSKAIYHNIQYPDTVGNKTLLVEGYKLSIFDLAQNKVVKNLSDSYGNIALEKLNVNGTYLTKEGVAINFKDKPALILNVDGLVAYKTNFEKLGNIVDGKIAFWKEGKVGILDLTKKEVIVKPEYDDISNIYNGSVLLLKGEQWFIHKFK